MKRFVPNTLLDTVPDNVRAKRWVVTAWVLYGDRKPTMDEVRAAREVWDIAPTEYGRGSLAHITVLSVLLQLERIGLVEDIEPIEGGYQVTGKAVAA